MYVMQYGQNKDSPKLLGELSSHVKACSYRDSLKIYLKNRSNLQIPILVVNTLLQ